MSVSILALATALQASAGKPEAATPPPVLAPNPMAVSPPAPPAPRPTHAPSRTRAMANLASYISNDDYPAEALYNEEQGTTGFRLVVGVDGRVTDCEVTQSSGSPSLDETTCYIMSRRARFTPARDHTGSPTTDSLTARISWQVTEVPEPGAPPVGTTARPIVPLAALVTAEELRQAALGTPAPEGYRTHFRLEIGTNGRVTGCTLPNPPRARPDLDEAACRIMRERARFNPQRNAAGLTMVSRHRGHINWISPSDGRPWGPPSQSELPVVGPSPPLR